MLFFAILYQLFSIFSMARANVEGGELFYNIFVYIMIDLFLICIKSSQGSHSSGNYTYIGDSRQESFDKGYIAGRDMVGEIHEDNPDFMTGFYAGDFDSRHDIR